MSSRQIDQFLEIYRHHLGADYRAYRGHCQRVYHTALHFYRNHRIEPAEEETLALAAALHDIGIWTNHTFDYLDPSVALAEKTLQKHSLPAYPELLRQMIESHHQLRSHPHPLVNAFRKADWCEVLGLGGFTSLGRKLKREYPLHGFHLMLTREFIKQVKKDPLHPLPMMRW